jgi:hypothetical protein
VSKVSDVNEITNGSEAIFKLKTVLKSAGWTVPESSDGTTYNASGDQISHASSGAGGMENNYAWFVIRDPGSSHEWCFQRGTTNLVWRVKMSSLDKFSGGSPDNNTVSSATDEQIMFGGGTDASPTFSTLFFTDNAYRFHVIAQDTAVGTEAPIYGFCAFSTKVGTGIPTTFIFQEPMALDTFPELSSGTRASPVLGDPDPAIYGCSYSSSGVNFLAAGNAGTYSWNSSNTSGNTPKAWRKMNYDGEAFLGFASANFYCGNYTSGKVAPGSVSIGAGSDPCSGQEIMLPLIIGRTVRGTTYTGLKGFCENMKLRTVYKNYPNVVDLTTDAKVYVQDLVLPWENNTIPKV